MATSIWTATLDTFNSDLAGTNPTPAAGSVASVSARLAISVLIKALEIARARSQPRDHLDVLIHAARIESEILAKAADEDGEAFAEYLALRRKKADAQALHAAILRATEVPMTAARASVRALAVSREALPLVPVFVVADLGAAALLLYGAVRATLITVDYNLRQLTAQENGHEKSLAAERLLLEDQAVAHTDAIVDLIGTK